MDNNTKTTAKEKKKFSFKDIIYNDKYLIFFSVLLAVLVWIMTSLSIGTNESKTVKVQVPIKLGDEVSKQLDMQYYTLQNTVELSVTITGAKYVIGQVTDDDLSVKFDTSNVNRTGEQSIPILVTDKSKSLDFKVNSFYPTSVQCYFDVNSTKTFDLGLNYDESKVADGYLFGTPVLSEDKIIVSGPKTYVDKIDSAYLDVDFGDKTDLKELFTEDCSIEFKGSGVETSYLTISPKSDPESTIGTVSVSLPVLKQTSLPVTVDFEDVPKRLPNNAISVSYSTDKINAGVLDSADISKAVIGTVNFSRLNVGKNEFEFDITQLSGITLLDDSVTKIKATVTVPATYEKQSVGIKKEDVELVSPDKNLKYTVNSINSSKLTVISEKGASVDSTAVSLKCDLSKITESGTYEIDASVNGDDMWVYGRYTVNITVSK